MEENREKNNKKIEDEKRLEQDLRQMADDVILPDSLEPEAIQKMLQARQEEKQQGSKAKNRKKNWKRIVPIAAAACVCVVVGATVGIKQINKGNNKTLDAATIASAADQTETTQTLTTAKDYKEIEKCIKEYNKQMARDNNSMAIGLYESASSADAATAESSNVSDTGGYSDTNVRENGVGEADIVKTDGKNIYTLCRSVVTITAIDNGSMEKLASIEQGAERYVEDIYVQDDKLVLFGTLGRQVGNSEDSEAYDGYMRTIRMSRYMTSVTRQIRKRLVTWNRAEDIIHPGLWMDMSMCLVSSILMKTMLQQEICGIFRKCRENLSKQKIFICHRKQKEMNIRSLQHFH